jgi:hypothetical protein
MSFVSVQPEILTTTAGELAGAGSALSAQNTAAAAPTTGLVPAAADEVSAATAGYFVAQAQAYQAVSAQAAAIHNRVVSMLTTDAHSYADTEGLNAAGAGLDGV